MAKPVSWTKGFSANITANQQELVVAFENMLVGAAARASREIGALAIANAGAHGAKLQERFAMVGDHRFYRASLGSSVERIIYKYLQDFFVRGEPLVAAGGWAGVYKAKMGTATDLVDIVFAVEYTSSHTPYLPCSFKKSRPDLRLALGPDKLGKPQEALFDLTSEGQIGHILKKGDAWLNKSGVAYVSEIVWVNDDIMHK